MAQELFVIDADLAVNCNPGGKFHGWLFRRHPDGNWVSVRKLAPIAPETIFLGVIPKSEVPSPQPPAPEGGTDVAGLVKSLRALMLRRDVGFAVSTKMGQAADVLAAQAAEIERLTSLRKFGSAALAAKEAEIERQRDHIRMLEGALIKKNIRRAELEAALRDLANATAGYLYDTPGQALIDRANLLLDSAALAGKEPTR